MKLLALVSVLTTFIAATDKHHHKACQFDIDCDAKFRCHQGNNYSMCLPRAATRRMFVCADKSTFHGDDMSITQSTYQSCMDQCQSNDKCNAFTWMPAIDNTRDGECRLKHLMDVSRQATPVNHTMQACQAVNWVLKPMHRLQGPVLTKLLDIVSMDSCLDACINMQQCVGVSYDKDDRSCVLHKKATSYSRNNMMAGTATAAIRHGYRACIANGDILLNNDMVNFVGAFQDCSKCVSNYKMNAFAWLTLGDNVGTCYCKNMVSSSTLMMTTSNDKQGFIVCMV